MGSIPIMNTDICCEHSFKRKHRNQNICARFNGDRLKVFCCFNAVCSGVTWYPPEIQLIQSLNLISQVPSFPEFLHRYYACIYFKNSMTWFPSSRASIAQSVKSLSCLMLWGSGTIDPIDTIDFSPTNRNGLAAMLVTKTSVDVRPDTLQKVQKILPYALKSENMYLLIVYGRCFHSLILRRLPLKSMLYP